MLTLNDPLWQGLEGGYKIRYDVSVPLRRLEGTVDQKEMIEIFNELWDELHHQGDVGVASYMAVPQLVRIAKQKGMFDWNILALCATIEQQRHLGNNPALPHSYANYYEKGLAELKQFTIDNLASIDDETTLISALSALAACNGHAKLSKAIFKLSDGVLDEFLEQC